ncbi:MAG: phosphoribosylformylglycinamidine synthase subunit PurS [Bacteroidota bacterium]|nr:phosphoribosylformylglycinamidine synthase subunit PurS [Candidatus Kapabacteria bacterium]MCS7302447.1 phosphoribosylformylglycinamidine synthase subunit PurS [Candidatus Kapabacteria bacterium]MCX7936336.1 phosphoribosylformylglycinamidine synthase subunit PurS [Chlorobiota bacterium]MDW8074383.1 phosphoribosylformylglycinamidine synthase subunit PurS [Bacteroidota bacterium]MDW8271141.1 phosphoribosylformylglycinamidine synthase subunit PurS [Bacteroidota bacterium]
MALFQATITITLRSAILDVQGKTVEHALHALGFTTVQHVRIGKYITLELEATDSTEALSLCNQMSEQLLANPVIEDYTVTIEQLHR